MTTASHGRTPVPCYRFPCDTAHRRGSHTPNDAGRILHQVAWGEETRRVADEDGSLAFQTVWATRAIAWDDDPWTSYIFVEDGRRAFTSTDDARRFLAGLQTSLISALESNAEEASRHADRLEELLIEVEQGADA